jgi:hypothetical protein
VSRSGFFARLLGRTQQPAASLAQRSFQLAHSGFSKVVGESHYQDALARTAQVARKELDEEGEERLCFEAVLVREPTNAYDARAVAVYSPAGVVGYAPRGSEWCDLLDVLSRRGYDGVSCRANLAGGEGEKSWGVVLHARPELELERLGDEVS